MSELNEKTRKQIDEWVAAAGSTESLGEDRLAELKSHLVDSTCQLTGLGLSEAEAVSVARSRMGDVTTLANEYRKGDSTFVWANRVFWMCIGYVSIHLAQMLVEAASMLTQSTLNWMSPYSTRMTWWTMPTLAILGWGGVFLLLWQLATRSSRLAGWVNQRRFLWLTVTLLALVTACQIVGQIQLTRWLSVEDVGRVMIVRAHQTFIAQIFIPLGMVAFAFCIRRYFASGSTRSAIAS